MNNDELLKERTALLLQGLEVVEDFMPNIATCVLQDYGRLNDFLIRATKVQKQTTSADAITDYYTTKQGKGQPPGNPR